jgi:hypothetical protein
MRDMAEYSVKIGRERIMGLAEIAAAADVQYRTAVMWRHRGILPKPDGIVTGTPLWRERTVVRWLEDTDRMPDRESHPGDP